MPVKFRRSSLRSRNSRNSRNYRNSRNSRNYRKSRKSRNYRRRKSRKSRKSRSYRRKTQRRIKIGGAYKNEKWWRDVNKEEADVLLKDTPDGTYLVRPSSRSRTFVVLSVKKDRSLDNRHEEANKNGIYNFQLYKVDGLDEKYSIHPPAQSDAAIDKRKATAKTLPDMIKEYKKNGPPNSAGDVIGLGDPINTAYAFLTPYPATAAPGHMTSEAGINYELDRSKDPKSASLYTASAANTSTQHLKFEQHGKQGSVLEQVGNEVVVQPNLENALSIEDQAARWIWQDKNRMNRHVAEKVLSAKKVGTYLVRAGTLTPWVLSVKESEGNINHVRIYEKHGLFFLGLGTRDETSVEGHEALSSQSQSESITILIDKIKEKKGLIAPLEDTSRERS